MSHLHHVLAFLVTCLWVCSCDKDRSVPVANPVSIACDNSVANGEAQLTTTPILTDTRSPEEYADGHLDGALLMPHNTMAA